MSIRFETNKHKEVRRVITFDNNEQLIIDKVDYDTSTFTLKPIDPNLPTSSSTIGKTVTLPCNLRYDNGIVEAIKNNFKIYGKVTGDRILKLEEIKDRKET